MASTEKRNSSHAKRCGGMFDPGVGGRQGGTPFPAGGGGYPDICTEKKLDLSDSRLNELRALGLQRVWLKIAESVGVDNFLTMWRLLCNEVDVYGDMQRVYVPRFQTYLRFQRNRVILALRGEGKNWRAIRLELKRTIGEDVSENHIYKIVKNHKRALINGE